MPDLGEGLTESELVAWHVAVGDTVILNQPLAEVETAKAIVQVPSPFAGVIAKLYAEPGQTVAVGAPLASFELAVAASPVVEPVSPVVEPVSPVVEPVEPVETVTPVVEPVETVETRTAILVGYGPAVESGKRPKRKAHSFTQTDMATLPTDSTRWLAVPPVRKLAHDLGVDLGSVVGTGAGGAITREDVQGATSASPALGRRDTRTPIKGVRKATAAAMVASAFTAPHVTEFLTIDVTRTMELVTRLKTAGTSATLLAVVAKAMCLAVPRTPEVNSHWDDAAAEILRFGGVQLGVAVATPRGLLVPVVRDADRLTLSDLTDAIAATAAEARAGGLSPAALTGSTISVTNVGVFGVDAGTPIINPGEAAILAVGAVRRLPWEYKGEVALRDVMTLSLSFDHRLVDGEQGSRFLVDIGSVLADPASVLTLV
jgi:pyruvate dehydrogenase E2 component (dihydrolipoamide acetyltransferase)